MPLDRNKIHTIYSALKENGDYEADYATFENEFAGNENYKKRKAVYDTLKKGGADVGSTYEEFMQRMQSKQHPSAPKQSQSASPSGDSAFPSPQQPPMAHTPASDSMVQQLSASADRYADGVRLPQASFRDASNLKSPFQRHGEAQIAKSMMPEQPNLKQGQLTMDEKGNAQWQMQDAPASTDTGIVYTAGEDGQPQAHIIGQEGSALRLSTEEKEAKERRDYYKSLDDRISDLDRRIEQGYQDTYGRDVNARRGSYYGITPTAQASRESILSSEAKDYMAVQNLMKTTKRMQEAAQRYKDNPDALIRFAKDTGISFWNSLTDFSTWDFGMQSADEAIRVRKLYDKFAAKGEASLTPSERDLLDAVTLNTAAQMALGDKQGIGNTVGQTSAEMLPFMIEMLVNPASGVSKEASKATAKAIARYAAKRFLQGSMKKGTAKALSVTGKYGSRFLYDIGAGALMSATTSAPHVVADAERRRTGTLYTDENGNRLTDEDGNVGYQGDSAASAYAKAFGARTIENQSELFGDAFLEPLTSKLGKFILRGIESKAGGRYLGKILTSAQSTARRAANTSVGRSIAKFNKGAHYNGIINEYLEEVVGNFENAATVGDNNFKLTDDEGNISFHEDSSVFNFDDNFATFLAVAVPGIVQGAASHAQYQALSRIAGRGLSRSEDFGFKAFGWEDWLETMQKVDGIDFSDAAAAAAQVKAIIQSDATTEDQACAITRYAQAAAMSQSLEISQQVQEEEETSDLIEAIREERAKGSEIDSHADAHAASREADQAEASLGNIRGGADIKQQIDDILAAGEQGGTALNAMLNGLTPEQRDAAEAYIQSRSKIDGIEETLLSTVSQQVDDKRAELTPYISEQGTFATMDIGGQQRYVKGFSPDMTTVYYFDEEGKVQSAPITQQDFDASFSGWQEAEDYLSSYRAQLEQSAYDSVNQQLENHPSTVTDLSAGAEYSVPVLRDGETRMQRYQVISSDEQTGTVTVIPMTYKPDSVTNEDGTKSAAWVAAEGADPISMSREEAIRRQNEGYDAYDKRQAEQDAAGQNVSATEQDEEGRSNDDTESNDETRSNDGSEASDPNAGQVAASNADQDALPSGVSGFPSPQQENQQQSQQPQSALSLIPLDEQGQPIYEKTDPDTAWDAILEQTEGDADMAQAIAADMVSDKEAALKKAQSAKPRKGATVAEKIAAQKEHKAAIDRAQSDLDHWKQIAATQQRRQEAGYEPIRRGEASEQAQNGTGSGEETKGAESAGRKPTNAGGTPERQGDLDKIESIKLSDEIDENGRQFVLTSEGKLAFGEIGEDSGLTTAPILLSEGMITNAATNDGYGLVHIEARHGDQIRKAGYKSVVDFIETVAKNYDVIKEGNLRDGHQTYRLQLTDKHNNTLMVELSGDGNYWNVNTAGIFKTSYGKKNKEVYSRHTTAKQPVETDETSQDAEQSDTQASSSMNVPTSSASKDTDISSESQENTKKSTADDGKKSLSAQEAAAAAESIAPEWHEDTPQAARARGYRRQGGHTYRRQEPVQSAKGKEVEVKFADNVKQKAHVTVMDASSLQPSHMNGKRNISFFLDEAQPKERDGQESTAAAEKIASSINPEEITSSVTAYTGAPTVNTRGEVIQGNNRSAALKTMWQNHPEQAEAYKQHLIDHASDFGLTPEDIESMDQPVLVNMADVEDGRAITLGQYTASDTESGGTERIKAKATAQKMGADMTGFTSRLLRSEDEDETISQLIDANAVETLKWMQRQGYITPTQYRSAFDRKGNLTAEAANDLKSILYETIFQGGSTQLREMFSELPAKAQKAILAIAYRDYDSPASERILPELQRSIIAYHELSHFAPFAKAKGMEELQNAIIMWQRQYQIDESTGESYLPSEKYSNFALQLAAMYKGQTQRLVQSTLSRIFDLIQGKQEQDLFSDSTEDNTPRTMAEAIREVLNIEYNGKTGSNALGSDDAASPARRQGSPRSDKPDQQGTRSQQPADNTGGTGVSDDERGTESGSRKLDNNGRIAERRENLPTDKQTSEKEFSEKVIESDPLSRARSMEAERKGEQEPQSPSAQPSGVSDFSSPQSKSGTQTQPRPVSEYEPDEINAFIGSILREHPFIGDDLQEDDCAFDIITWADNHPDAGEDEVKAAAIQIIDEWNETEKERQAKLAREEEAKKKRQEEDEQFTSSLFQATARFKDTDNTEAADAAMSQFLESLSPDRLKNAAERCLYSVIHYKAKDGTEWLPTALKHTASHLKRLGITVKKGRSGLKAGDLIITSEGARTVPVLSIDTENKTVTVFIWNEHSETAYTKTVPLSEVKGYLCESPSAQGLLNRARAMEAEREAAARLAIGIDKVADTPEFGKRLSHHYEVSYVYGTLTRSQIKQLESIAKSLGGTYDWEMDTFNMPTEEAADSMRKAMLTAAASATMEETEEPRSETSPVPEQEPQSPSAQPSGVSDFSSPQSEQANSRREKTETKSAYDGPVHNETVQSHDWSQHKEGDIFEFEGADGETYRVRFKHVERDEDGYVNGVAVYHLDADGKPTGSESVPPLMFLEMYKPSSDKSSEGPTANPLDRARAMEAERKGKQKQDDLRRRSLREAPASVLPKATQSILSKIAKSFGAEVRYLPTDADSNGLYDPETNTIYLVQDANEALSFVFGHELTHMVKSFSQESYDRLLTAAKQALGSQFGTFASKKETLYRSHGYNYGREYYEEEAAADTIGSMIDNGDMARAILRRLTHPVLTRILDALDHVINLFRGEKAKNAARLRKEIEQAIAAAATSSQRRSDGQTRHAFSGEKGAAAADRSESATIRRESLAIAKAMLSEGKDAKAIKLATGWEMGKDGKWRREVPDAAFNAPLKDLLRIINTTSGDERQQALKIANNDYATLGSSVKADELFKAYPQLKGIRLIFDDTLPKEEAGHYSEKNNAIVINASDFHPEMQSTLIHELQHAIQRIEGFATGGSIRSAMEYLSSGTFDSKFADISIKKQVAYELSQKNNLGLTKEEVNSLIDNLENDSYPEDKLQQQIDGLCAKHGITEDQLEDIYDMDNVWHEAYRRIAGEVEARNVQTRRRMTEDERRSTLAADTEDVPRHDQIVLRTSDRAVRHSLRDSEDKETDRVLRDALIDHMRSFGMDVITDEKEGQRVLDMANEESVRLRAKKRRALETATWQQHDVEANQATVVSSADGAKILKNLDTLADQLAKNESNRSKTFMGNVAKAIGASEKGSSSQYATFETKNGTMVTIRLANHNASTIRFDNAGRDNAISIVITNKNNTGIERGGNAHIVEFYYNKGKLINADGKPLADIVRSIKQALYSGEYTDTTGLAERQEVNAGDVARYQKAYHGSGADFDAFDHSHMGEGQGAQAYGWGTYVTEVEGIAEGYADAYPRLMFSNGEGIEWMRKKLHDDIISHFNVKNGISHIEISAFGDLGDFDINMETLPAWQRYFIQHPENFESSRLYRKDPQSYTPEERKEGRTIWLHKAPQAYNLEDRKEENEFYEDVLLSIEMYAQARKDAYMENAVKIRNIYTVDIPDDTGENYLPWKKPLTHAQMKTINEELAYLMESPALPDRLKEKLLSFNNGYPPVINIYEGDTGEQAYERIASEITDKYASKFLSSLGFAGIKYPANYRSGGNEEGKSNYVIFNETDAKITDRVRFFRTPEGEAYGYTINGKIYIDPRIATSETPIHEYTHLWATALRKQDHAAWQGIVRAMRDTSLWNEVKDNYKELETDDDIADEVLSHYSGKRGSARLTAEMRKLTGEKRSDPFAKAAAMQAVSRVRNALRTFWKKIASLFHLPMDRAADADAIADTVLSDLLGRVDPRSNGINPSLRKQFIGERGAEKADRAEEVNTRLENLRVARKMETDGKDAKIIKMATGWERGADGKWRYEIQDIKYHPKGDAEYKKLRNKQPWSKELDALDDRFFDGEQLTEDESKRYDELSEEYNKFKADFLSRERNRLADWVENKDLFDAYPDLKNVEIVFTDQLPESESGYYSKKENRLVVNTASDMDTDSVIAHEIQHAIQRIEGFARGGSPKSVEREFQKAKAEWKARAYASELEETAKKLGEYYNQEAVEKALVKEYEDMDMSAWLPDKETRIKGFNYFVRGYADSSLDDAIKGFRLNESTRADFSPYREYRKLGGEVESRNVQKRMGMTLEERRASLAAETEDVAREDQTFLFDSDGVDAMGSLVMSAENHSTDADLLMQAEQNPEGTLRHSLRHSLRDEEADLADVNRRFNERLDSLMKDPAQKGRELQLGRPGRFLEDAGLGDSEIVLDYDKIVKKSSESYRNEHPFDIADIKDLPNAINSPIAVFNDTNGHDHGNVILTELQKGGNNFIVAVRAVERRKKGGVVLEVNEIKSLFPKEARGIVNWLNTNKASNINKEKALAWLGALRNHRGTELTEQELSDAAKVVENFESTKVSGEKADENQKFRLLDDSDPMAKELESLPQ